MGYLARKEMKRLLIIGLIAASLVGCVQPPIVDGELNKNHFQIIHYEGCEYIIVEYGYPGYDTYSFSITHKGNCNNPIHKYNDPH